MLAVACIVDFGARRVRQRITGYAEEFGFIVDGTEIVGFVQSDRIHMAEFCQRGIRGRRRTVG